MRLYDFKRGHKKDMSDIEKIMRDMFNNVHEENGKLIAEYGGLERIEVWLDGKKLAVETKSKYVGEQEAINTLKVWNDFLFKVTGYTSKERKKKMSK